MENAPLDKSKLVRVKVTINDKKRGTYTSHRQVNPDKFLDKDKSKTYKHKSDKDILDPLIDEYIGKIKDQKLANRVRKAIETIKKHSDVMEDILNVYRGNMSIEKFYGKHGDKFQELMNDLVRIKTTNARQTNKPTVIVADRKSFEALWDYAGYNNMVRITRKEIMTADPLALIGVVLFATGKIKGDTSKRVIDTAVDSLQYTSSNVSSNISEKYNLLIESKDGLILRTSDKADIVQVISDPKSITNDKQILIDDINNIHVPIYSDPTTYKTKDSILHKIEDSIVNNTKSIIDKVDQFYGTSGTLLKLRKIAENRKMDLNKMALAFVYVHDAISTKDILKIAGSKELSGLEKEEKMNKFYGMLAKEYANRIGFNIDWFEIPDKMNIKQYISLVKHMRGWLKGMDVSENLKVWSAYYQQS